MEEEEKKETLCLFTVMRYCQEKERVHWDMTFHTFNDSLITTKSSLTILANSTPTIVRAKDNAVAVVEPIPPNRQIIKNREDEHGPHLVTKVALRMPNGLCFSCCYEIEDCILKLIRM